MSTEIKRDLSAFGKDTPALTVVEGIKLSGKVAVVTGGASGIGVETARALATAGAHVIIAARDTGAAKSVVEDIQKSSGNAHVEAIALDLSELASVAAFVAEFKKRKLPLHILINNAGVMACPQSTTKDGFETQFGVNHLGHFFLTTLLLDVLVASKARVVNVSSLGHQFSDIEWDDVMHTKPGSYDKWRAYGQSKTANILFANELFRRYSSSGLQAFSVHPGSIRTNLQRHVDIEEFKELAKRLPHVNLSESRFKTVQAGASTSVLAATAPEYEGKGGIYFENCQPATTTDVVLMVRGQAAHSLNVESGKRLWKLSLELLSKHFAKLEGGAELVKKLSADV